jgi:hypothetical protein
VINFLYKQREDETFVINYNGLPYHVTKEDPLYVECVVDYRKLEQLPPDEPPPPESPPIGG